MQLKINIFVLFLLLVQLYLLSNYEMKIIDIFRINRAKKPLFHLKFYILRVHLSILLQTS